jgi:glucose/arabinose dehydrogenase
MKTRIIGATLALTLAGSVWAQQKTEEPAWAAGRPQSEQAMAMAPVPAFPIPTAVADLPLSKMKLPPGFKIELWASNILDARGMRLGAKGTVFVSSLFVAGKIYAVVDKGGVREVKTIAENLMLPNGIEFYKGSLFVGTPKQIVRYDNIEDTLDKPAAPVTIYDKLPGDATHGWKTMRVGPDGKLYLPIGAPCNICLPDDEHGKIVRMNLDGSGVETVARGVRNTVGFDFQPKTGQLWFTDNARDWISEDLPNDKLNRVTALGQHFGFPFCHQGNFTDPQFGWGKNCADYVKPAALLGAHVAPLGMTFYTGKMFPKKYQGAIFIARHGSWNRTRKQGADVLVAFPDGKGGARTELFLSGLIQNNELLGRPVDVMQMRDGSLLVSDDHNGAIYRISYSAP